MIVSGHCYQVVNRRGTEQDGLDEGQFRISASIWETTASISLTCKSVILTHGHYGPPEPSEDENGNVQYFDFASLPPGDARHKIRKGIIKDNVCIHSLFVSLCIVMADI